MKIIELTDPTELYCEYKSQASPQPCYVELDLQRQTLHADYDEQIGGGVPFSVWHGHQRRYTIPCLVAHAANDLLHEIKPLAERVVAGYESIWDGSNHVARLSEDAEAAEDEIRRIIEAYSDVQTVSACDAEDWLSMADVDPDMTDAELSALAEKYESELEEHQIVEGIESCLRACAIICARKRRPKRGANPRPGVWLPLMRPANRAVAIMDNYTWVITTTEARRHNGENAYGPWIDLDDEDIPRSVADAIAEAIQRNMRREPAQANTDSEGSVEIGGERWVYRR